MTSRPYSTHIPVRKARWLNPLVLGAALLLFGGTANAQCLNTAAFGTITANNVLNVPQNISTCSFQSEYSTVNGTIAGDGYTFNILTGGYITVRSGTPSGPVVAHGVAPLAGVVSPGGTLYPHWNVDAACGLATNCVTTTITNNGPAVACTGTPNAGTISGPALTCTGTGVSLSTVGGTLASGLSYQWNSSATPGGPYSNAGSGLTFNTGPLANTTYYVCDVTCTNSGQTATTPEFTVTTIGVGPGGTFTIDNTLPNGQTNFDSFTNAINWLNSFGQCGAFTTPVVFNVAAGQVFNETPPAIIATGSVANPITFQRAGVGANPVLIAAGTAATNEAGLAINGGDFFTFDGIDVQAGNNLLEFGYVLRNASTTNGASNNTIRNCSITMDRTLTSSIALLHTTSTTGGGFTPTSAAGQNDNCLYENISISNSANGIYLFSASTVYVGVNNQVVGCTVGAPFLGLPTPDIGNPTLFVTTTGINMNNQTDCVVRDNIVQNLGSFGGTNRGIWIQNGRGNCYVYNNRIRGIRNTSPSSTGIQRGIESNCATTGTHTLFVYNNHVSGISAARVGTASATRVLSGIFLGSGSVGATYNVDFNSVSIDGSASPSVSSACLEFGGNTSTHNVRNNSLANFTGPQTGAAIHLVVRATSATIIGNTASVINYNNLYVADPTNGFIAQGSTTNWATIAAYDGAVTTPASNDANSVSVDPQYTDPAGNPTANATALNGAADITGIAWVTTDINNALRTVPHDIGANNIDGCSGTTNPGNTLASAASICPSTTVFFSLQNGTPGFGVTYLWEESVDGITFVPATGTNTNSTYSALWNAPLYIRCQVTCSGFSTETSTPVQVLVNSFLDCYCTSNATSTADEEIFNVTFNTLNNTSACGDLAPGAGSISNQYGNYKGLPATDVQQFVSYPLSLTLGSCGGDFNRKASVFIDWNRNGLLTDPGEEVATGDLSEQRTQSPDLQREHS